ncbi:MAG: O-antigen ligase family protein, partial [Candidatus Moranbacteria bacterium]|nr:O-antigen ligase family protein [Candidatus Moranbacteria bacterium]
SSISNVPCGTLDNYGASVEHILWGGTIIKNIFKIIIFLGLFQAIIGILQFILQHSVGLFWLKESLILLNIDGVAKIIFNGQKYIRAYGLFPHPNILGGFLLLSIIFTIYYKKMFHPSSISNVPPQNNCSMWNSLRGRHGTFKNYGAGTKQYKTLDFLILVQLLAIILTFSKSAILALIIALLYIFVPRLPREIINANVKNTDVPRETLNSNISDNLVFHWGGTIPFHKSILKRYWIPGFLVILSLFLIVRNIYPEMSSNIAKSINERSLYLNVSRGTIVQNPILGLGMGQFVINMQKYAIIKLENWQFQPVHNVFLLVWSELGIIGLILFMLMLWKLFHYVKFNFVPHETKLNHVTGTEQFRLIAKGILLGFIFIMIFDHYFWDIQQGQIMLWMIMAFTTGVKKID